MFIIFATKPLTDRTKGFRFNFLGIKGLYRKRSTLARPLSVVAGPCTTGLHLGKRSLYVERPSNRGNIRMLRHFAG